MKAITGCREGASPHNVWHLARYAPCCLENSCSRSAGEGRLHSIREDDVRSSHTSNPCLGGYPEEELPKRLDYTIYKGVGNMEVPEQVVSVALTAV
jgi:hypothetical protein